MAIDKTSIDTKLAGVNVEPQAQRSRLGYFSGLKYRILTAAAVVALALGAYSPKANASIVDFTENDGKPKYNDSTDLNKATWNIKIRNNSNAEPMGNPYNENITAAYLFDVYSAKQPQFGNLPDFWTTNITQGSSGTKWNIALIAEENPIAPGDNSDIELLTFKPASAPDFQVGTLYGQGRLQTEGLQPSSPGTPFQGPVGVTPEPATLALLALGSLALVKRRENQKENYK